jgi:molybdopterin converting factor small subunit
LATLFQLEAEGFPKSELRERAGQALAREIREALERDEQKATLQAKSDELSNNKQRWPNRAERDAVLRSLGIEALVDWVKQGNNAHSIRLQQGEPSRLASEQICKTLTAALSMCLVSWPQTIILRSSKIQVYQDRGHSMAFHGHPW